MKKPEASTNRELILNAALTCFVKSGFHQTGIRDIAREAGVSLGNLYNHFSGKDALITEIARLEAVEIDTLLGRLPPQTNPIDRICALAAALLAQEATPENAVLTADLTSEAMRNPLVSKVFADNEAKLAGKILQDIKIGVTQGLIALPSPPQICATLILDCARALGMRAAFERSMPVKTAQSALTGMIRRMLAV